MQSITANTAKVEHRLEACRNRDQAEEIYLAIRKGIYGEVALRAKEEAKQLMRTLPAE